MYWLGNIARLLDLASLFKSQSLGLDLFCRPTARANQIGWCLVDFWSLFRVCIYPIIAHKHIKLVSQHLLVWNQSGKITLKSRRASSTSLSSGKSSSMRRSESNAYEAANTNGSASCNYFMRRHGRAIFSTMAFLAIVLVLTSDNIQDVIKPHSIGQRLR